MSHVAYNFCTRDSMPAPAMGPPESALQPPIDTPRKPAKEAMTWQQQQDFGNVTVSEEKTPDQPHLYLRTLATGLMQDKVLSPASNLVTLHPRFRGPCATFTFTSRSSLHSSSTPILAIDRIQAPKQRNSRRVKWQPYDQEAVEAPTTIATETACVLSAQRDNRPTSGPRRKAHNKAATSGSTLHTTQPAPNTPTTPEQTPDNDAQKTAKPTHRKPRPRRNRNKKDGNMISLPKSAYIPPHLRKRGTATVAKVETEQEHHTPVVSPTASTKSKTEHQPPVQSSQ